MFFSRDRPATRLLMVCMGNICRSPMAHLVTEYLAQQAGFGKAVTVDSAGTHAARGSESPDRRAKTALLARGYPVGKLRARQITDQDFERHDQILAMDQANLNDLRRLCPVEHAFKLQLFMEFAEGFSMHEVPDPYYGNARSFEAVLDMVEAGARGLIAHHSPGWR
ncbi:MAG: low molecular weight phosphotyrosine protein phosphatase [Rhodoferax sp.]|nr:low molecular weight phosphotyrosine protein phosphatase [Rhodoferax sp.]